MALPFQSSSQILADDQRIKYRATFWDTTTTAVRVGEADSVDAQGTAFGRGVGYALFDLLDASFSPPSGSSPASGAAQTLEALLTDHTKSRAVLGYTDPTTYRTGVAPLIFDYWGAGAPVGASRAQQCVIKYTGFITEPMTQATLVLMGNGWAMATITRAGSGSVEYFVPPGYVKEPTPTIDLTSVNATVIQEDWGYRFNTTPLALDAGDVVSIYYVQNGENWGGIAAKMVAGGVPTDASFLATLRAAPLVGTSILSADASPLPGLPLPWVVDAEVRRQEGVGELRLRVGLAPDGEETGYFLSRFQNEPRLLDNTPGSALVVKEGRAVFFEGGYVRPDGSEEIYPRFTGYIDDISPDQDGLTATLTIRGFDGRLTEPFDENNPDRLAYQVFGYIYRERAAEPVFGIPAFDGWPLEDVGLLLLYKAGVDPYNIGRTVMASTAHVGKRRFKLASTGASYFGSKLFTARHLGDAESKVHIERQANYGNVLPLKKDYLPDDDTYLFPPQVTQRLYDRLTGIVEQYGYDFYFDAEGQAVLTGRNNATSFTHFSSPSDYGANVSAVGGRYFLRTQSDPAWTRQVDGYFSRLDLYIGIGEVPSGANGGKINITVERFNGSTWTAVGVQQFSTYADVAEAFYYDGAVRSDGTNACVIRALSLPFDRYRVTIAPAGPEEGETFCVYRINGAAIYERDPEQSYYPTSTTEYATFSTSRNMLRAVTEGTNKDLRNQVIVVGQRKAAVTDSEKFNEASSPNNPEREFHVAVAVDPFSIYDPTSPNYVGMKRMTVIFNDRISDTEFARWLARTILFRYRMPKPPVRFDHTAIPVMEFRDAMFVTAERTRAVDGMIWVREFTERWTPDEATVSGVASQYPEIPSFQPREDIDIDTYFVDPADGKGEPAINVKIRYKNLLKQDVTNSDLSDGEWTRSFVTKTPGSAAPMWSEQITDQTQHRVEKPVIPETMYLGWNVTHIDGRGNQGISFFDGSQISKKRALVNMPYRYFYNMIYDGTALPLLAFRFQEGDGTFGVYDANYYQFPSTATDRWYVCYDFLLARTGRSGTGTTNPFYDPYTSQKGNVVAITFDQLVSGRVRVSLWDANPSRVAEVPVAWLTAPGNDPEEPEAHWLALDSGKREFVWDGVDNIGFWNQLQSVEYAEAMQGSFGDKPLAVGRGAYVWNDRTANRHTLVGEDTTANYDRDGHPYFTIGQFGQFYVKIEVLNDTLVQKDKSYTPRTVDSTRLPNVGMWNETDQVYVWTHLGEPDQVAIRVQDWKWINPSTGALQKSWSRGSVTTEDDWDAYSTPDVNATLRAGKPVRFTFVPRPRRSPFWEISSADPSVDRTLDPNSVSVKLTRSAHLKATFFDQFWSFSGKTWEGLHQEIQASSEQKRLVNRMFHNEDHTLEWEDSSWRDGDALSVFEWIFDPTLFEKDFGSGLVEALRYGDYEQLEALPGFDGKRAGGTGLGTRAYLLMAFVNYLFYFSAHTLDKSGRRQFCLDSWTDPNGYKRGFIDRSKIVTDAWYNASDAPGTASYRPWAVVDYAQRGAETYLVRSIFVRQWVEPGWVDGSIPRSPVVQQFVGGPELKYVQPPIWAFSPHSNYFDGGMRDEWLTAYTTANHEVNRCMLIKSKDKWSGGVSQATLSTLGLFTFQCPPTFGVWDFDRPNVEGWFQPNPSRDFQPYWRFPFMPDIGIRYINEYITTSQTTIGHLSILEGVSSQIHYPLRDPARQERWYGFAYAANAQGIAGHHGARCEMTVEEAGALPGSTRKFPFYVQQAFDYVKQDDLDRFDQYRGVISRGPYPDGNVSERAQWLDGTKKERIGSPQPVKAAGVYLLNLGRYDAYTLAPLHFRERRYRSHFVTKVSNWSDVRFRHEYVWYADRYFPVLREGGAMYHLVGDEYTRVSQWCGAPWWLTLPNQTVFNESDYRFPFFDAGAWTGWKDDIPPVVFGLDWHLRWQEVGVVSGLGTSGSPYRYDLGVSAGSTPSLTGGFGVPFQFAQTGEATGNVTWLHATNPTSFARANIFDEYRSFIGWPRLAVGPEVPESRFLTMNLTLPSRLKG